MLNRLALICIFICPLLLTAVSGLADQPPAGQAKWTVMFYVAGDSNLEGLAGDDFETEFCRYGSNDDVEVTVLFDRNPKYDKKHGDWTGTLLFHCTEGMLALAENAVEDWGERSTGNPQTLAEFVTWSKAYYPAERYALVLWGHGWTWEPGWTMRDETDSDTLDLHEIDQAMRNAGPVELVVYDSCGPQVIETAAMWRNHAKVMVGQQFYSWWKSFEFDQAIAALQADPDMSAEQLAQVLVDPVKQFGASAVVLDERFDRLLEVVDTWSTALLAWLPVYQDDYHTAWRRTQYFGEKENKDLYDAAFEINQFVTNPAILAAGEAVMTALDAVVLTEQHHDEKFKDAHGLGITWHEAPFAAADYYFDMLEFSAVTHWDEFMEAYSTAYP